MKPLLLLAFTYHQVQEVYRLCQETINGKLTIKELSILIPKSYRQCQRLIKKVKNQYMLGIKRGNFGNILHSKTSSQDELDIKYPCGNPA